MKLRFLTDSLYLIREAGDKALDSESKVTFHIRRLLNEAMAENDGGRWHRFWPNRVGLTGCQQGVRSSKWETLYWHANYQIEAAHVAFNSGRVLYHKAIHYEGP